MSEDPARSFVDQVRDSAAMAPPTPEQALEAFRERAYAILRHELKFAEVEWTEQRNIAFAVADHYFWLAFDPDDPQFLSVISAPIARYADEAARVRALEAASATTQVLKVAKAVVYRAGDAWVAGAFVEVLLPGLDTLDRAFLRRLVRMLEKAISEFRDRYAQSASKS